MDYTQLISMKNTLELIIAHKVLYCNAYLLEWYIDEYEILGVLFITSIL